MKSIRERIWKIDADVLHLEKKLDTASKVMQKIYQRRIDELLRQKKLLIRQKKQKEYKDLQDKLI